MQKAFGKSAYKTVFLITILAFGILTAIFATPISAIDTVELLDEDNNPNTSGYVGDDDVIVNGTGANPFALVEIYWESIAPENLLTTATADDQGDFMTEDGDFEIPEDHAGAHWIIAVDGSGDNLGAEFTIMPMIELVPEEGLPDDRVDVTGTGFSEEEDVTIFFDWMGGYEEDVTRGTPETDGNGSFTTYFYVPDVDEDDWVLYVDVRANDSGGEAAVAEFIVGQYIHVDPDEGYPTWGPVEWEARAEGNTDYEVVFYDGDDLWISLANVTSDDDGEMDGTFNVPYNSEPGDGPEPDFGNLYFVELWDEDDDRVAGTEFTVYPYPLLEPEEDGAKANETVELHGAFFTRDEGVEVTVTLDGVEIGVFEVDEYGNFTEDFEVPNIEFGHYTLYAVDENGYEAEADFDVKPEYWGEMGTRQSVYFQGDKFSFWANTTYPDDEGQALMLFVNITDPDGVIYYQTAYTGGYENGYFEPWFWCVDQMIEGEYSDFYVLRYCEQWPYPKFDLPEDAPVGTWKWEAYDSDDGSYWQDDWDLWAEGEFEVVAKLTLDLVLDRLDEMEATIVGLFSDTEGNLMAYIDTKAGTLTASLADLNAKVVEVEGDTATLVTDLGMVKADVADIAGEFPLDIPTVDLTPMWAAVALSLIAAIAAIAAVVIVYQRIA
jgi:hypothetical protein